MHLPHADDRQACRLSSAGVTSRQPFPDSVCGHSIKISSRGAAQVASSDHAWKWREHRLPVVLDADDGESICFRLPPVRPPRPCRTGCPPAHWRHHGGSAGSADASARTPASARQSHSGVRQPFESSERRRISAAGRSSPRRTSARQGESCRLPGAACRRRRSSRPRHRA